MRGLKLIFTHIESIHFKYEELKTHFTHIESIHLLSAELCITRLHHFVC